VVTWQTVVLSVSAALVTGTAAVLVAWMNISSQRRGQLQTRRVEAASDFAKRFNGATDAARFALGHPGDEGALRNAAHLAGEVTPFVGPVSLLFGDGSAVTREAEAALGALQDAVAAAGRGEREEAAATLTASAEHRAGFEAAARRVVA
jgi:hypothetical protein